MVVQAKRAAQLDHEATGSKVKKDNCRPKRVALDMQRCTVRVSYGKKVPERVVQMQRISMDGLEDLVLRCVDKPARILHLAKYAVDQDNFKTVTVEKKADCLHPTQLYLSSVPKAMWTAVLVEYGHTHGANPAWTPSLLKRMDAKHGLQGIQRFGHLLSDTEKEDRIPKGCHYKPTLQRVLQKAMLTPSELLNHALPVITSDGNMSFADCGYFKFGSPGEDGRIREVVSRGGHRVNIPDDYFVTAGGDWQFQTNERLTEARLKGKRADPSIFEWFQEELQWNAAIIKTARQERLAQIASVLTSTSTAKATPNKRARDPMVVTSGAKTRKHKGAKPAVATAEELFGEDDEEEGVHKAGGVEDAFSISILAGNEDAQSLGAEEEEEEEEGEQEEQEEEDDSVAEDEADSEGSA